MWSWMQGLVSIHSWLFTFSIYFGSWKAYNKSLLNKWFVWNKCFESILKIFVGVLCYWYIFLPCGSSFSLSRQVCCICCLHLFGIEVTHRNRKKKIWIIILPTSGEGGRGETSMHRNWWRIKFSWGRRVRFPSTPEVRKDSLGWGEGKRWEPGQV